MLVLPHETPSCLSPIYLHSLNIIPLCDAFLHDPKHIFSLPPLFHGYNTFHAHKEMFPLLCFQVFLPLARELPGAGIVVSVFLEAQSYRFLDFCPINKWRAKTKSVPGVEEEYYFRSSLRAMRQALCLLMMLLEAFASQRLLLMHFEPDCRGETCTVAAAKRTRLHEIPSILSPVSPGR